MDTQRKLAILADAAKYDASCASSGAQGASSLTGRGLGAPSPSGVCHSFTPDGRCVSLLKILLTNWCVYDCLYCVNRVSSDTPRARFTVAEVVALTLDFYRRNLIEGLFLSSGIIQSADYTMGQLVGVARTLREVHDFRGYIHLKTIAEADPALIAEAGRWADRLSVNVELATEAGLARLAPQKQAATIRLAMGTVSQGITAARPPARRALTVQAGVPPRRAPPPRFAPAGQSTQLIVGADTADDATLIAASSRLYGEFGLRRVYYSAFSPIPGAPLALPAAAPPLAREHRLYQADWLMRFYGFAAQEIVPAGGMLALDMDPKLAWALAHRHLFPVRLDVAPRELLLRVPGLGVRSVARILAARRVRTLRRADLQRLRVPLSKVLPFVEVADHHPGAQLDDPALASALARPLTMLGAPQPQQWSLF